jgi:hypothetical protein
VRDSILIANQTNPERKDSQSLRKILALLNIKHQGGSFLLIRGGSLSKSKNLRGFSPESVKD